MQQSIRVLSRAFVHIFIQKLKRHYLYQVRATGRLSLLHTAMHIGVRFGHKCARNSMVIT